MSKSAISSPPETRESNGTNHGGKPEKSTNPLAPKMQNRFQARRNITQGMYDVALLMANVSQLKTVLDNDKHKYYILLMILLIASISLHIMSAVILYVIMIIEKNKENKMKHIQEQNDKKEKDSDANAATLTECPMCSHEICQCWKVSRLDGIATFGVFAVTLLNIFITAFLSDRKDIAPSVGAVNGTSPKV